MATDESSKETKSEPVTRIKQGSVGKNLSSQTHAVDGNFSANDKVRRDSQLTQISESELAKVKKSMTDNITGSTYLTEFFNNLKPTTKTPIKIEKKDKE